MFLYCCCFVFVFNSNVVAVYIFYLSYICLSLFAAIVSVFICCYYACHYLLLLSLSLYVAITSSLPVVIIYEIICFYYLCHYQIFCCNLCPCCKFLYRDVLGHSCVSVLLFLYLIFLSLLLSVISKLDNNRTRKSRENWKLTIF